LPEDYVDLPVERVAIYRRLAEAKKLVEVEAIREELADRFGRLPEAAENLLGLVSLKLLGTALGLRSLRVFSKESVGIFSENGRPQKGEPLKKWIGSMVERATRPFEFISDFPSSKIKEGRSLGFRLPISEKENVLPHTVKFLRSLVTEAV
jgi:transcription-repair coupling factor (superfamily II helicase)